MHALYLMKFVSVLFASIVTITQRSQILAIGIILQ